MSPHERMRMSKMLMAEQWNRPAAIDAPVQQRATVLPLATYADGKTAPAMPGLISEPINSMARLLQNGYQPGTNDVRGVEDAFNVAGGAMTGGLLGPRPRGSVGMGGHPTDNAAWVDAYRGQGEQLANGELFRPQSYFATDARVANKFANSMTAPLPMTREVDAPRTGMAGFIDRLFGRDPPTTTVTEYPSWNRKRQSDGAAVYPVKIDTSDYVTVDWPSWNRKHPEYKAMDPEVRKALSKHGDPVDFWDWHAQDAIDKAIADGAPGVILKNIREESAPKRVHDQIIPLKQRDDGRPSVKGRYSDEILFANAKTGAAVPLMQQALDKPKGGSSIGMGGHPQTILRDPGPVASVAKYPLAPAVKVDGKIYIGDSHVDAMGYVERELKLPAAQFNKIKFENGYLTNNGDFVTREGGTDLIGVGKRGVLGSDLHAMWKRENGLPDNQSLMRQFYGRPGKQQYPEGVDTSRILYRGAAGGAQSDRSGHRFMTPDYQSAEFFANGHEGRGAVQQFIIKQNAKLADVTVDTLAPDVSDIVARVAAQYKMTPRAFLKRGIDENITREAHRRKQTLLKAVEDAGYDLVRIHDSHGVTGDPLPSIVDLNGKGVEPYTGEQLFANAKNGRDR